MKNLIVALVVTAGVGLFLSCGVGPAYNCFSTNNCPAGMACVDSVCVDGANVSKDTGVIESDDGGGGVLNDGGVAHDGGAVHECLDRCATHTECKSWCDNQDFGCMYGSCSNVKCSGTMDCADVCSPMKPICDYGTCRCGSTCSGDADCIKRCDPAKGSCIGGACVCESGECKTDADCGDVCQPGSGYCTNGTCACGGTGCATDSECNDWQAPYCHPKLATCVGCWNDKHCDGGPCDPYAWTCGGCTSDCTGKECGQDGCGGSCGTCTWGETCDGWKCIGCSGACGNSSYCGAPDGCGGSCPGYCNDPNQKCEPTPGGSWMCTGSCTPACGNSMCGGPDGCGGYCWGQCPNAGEQCAQGADGLWTCIGGTCDPNGIPAHGACTTQSDCACGNDCVRIGDVMTQPQTMGECLAHCSNGGACADATNLCMCTQVNGGGGCATSSCFPQGTLKGNFNGKVLNSCNDQPAQTDIGQGTLTLTMQGKSASFNMFVTCRYTDGSTSSDYVLVQGLKACGTQICPDVMILGIQAAKVAIGTINYQSGNIFTQWAQYTFSGQSVTDVWIRGYGVSGSVTLTQAGKTGKAPIAGTADITMVGYNSESCGGSSGISCQ